MAGMPMHDDDAITIPPGQTRTLRFTPTRTGELLCGCHVPGHWLAGMRGTLAVSS